jgi:hypothetical protein
MVAETETMWPGAMELIKKSAGAHFGKRGPEFGKGACKEFPSALKQLFLLKYSAKVHGGRENAQAARRKSNLSFFTLDIDATVLNACAYARLVTHGSGRPPAHARERGWPDVHMHVPLIL